jgi:hypothetical protein
MRIRPLLSIGLLAVPAALPAQLPSATARSTAMLQSYTAAARGYEAIVWNPALLAMPGRPGFSLNLAQVAADVHSNTLGPSDVLHYLNDTLDTAAKDKILAETRAGGDSTLSLGATANAQALGLTIGPFGIMATGLGDASAAVSDDAVELALFGNVTRRAPGQRYLAAGTTGSGWAGASVAIGFGLPLHVVPVGHLAVGATLKLTQMFIAGIASDAGSFLQNAPNFSTRAAGQALLFHPDSSATNNGFGVGLDVGVAYDLVSGIRLCLAVENVFSTISWKEQNLVYYRQDYIMEQVGDQFTDSTVADIEMPYDPTDPNQLALHDSLIGAQTFPTRVRAGVLLSAGPLRIAGDAMLQLKRGLVPGDKQRLSAGAELPLKFFALRAGLSSNFSGSFSYGGGFGFKMGPVRLDLGASATPGGSRQGMQAAFGLSVMN